MSDFTSFREGTVQEAFQVVSKIPEFENSYPLEEYFERIEGVDHLILIAYSGEQFSCL